MADKISRRPLRFDNASGRGGSAEGLGPSAENDPLAELARLIGQDDPFANLKSEATHKGLSRNDGESARRAMGAAAGWPPRPNIVRAADWPQESRDDRSGDRYAHDRADEDADYDRDQPQHEPADERYAPYAAPTGDARYARHDEEYDERYDAQAAAGAHDYQNYAEPPYEEDAYRHEDDGYRPPEPSYENQPQLQRRGGILTVAAVLGVAVVGTAGAFGYYALSGGSTSSSPPPVIKADVTPAKVVPSGTGAEGQQGKLIYDRVADKPRGENIVPREEQPLDVKQAAKLMPPRVVGPGGVTGSTDQSAAAATPTTGGLPPAMSLQIPPRIPPAIGSPNEPKKVKTVTIRPDMTIAPEVVTGAPQPASSATVPTPSAPPVATQRVRTPPVRRTQPNESTTVAAAAQPDQNWPPPAEGQPDRVPAPRATPPARAPQLAAVTPAAPAPAQTAAPSGGFVVQISSQKSESEAQASFRALQAKYPDVLSNRQPLIRRADLGSRGIYYRAQVGPFATSDQAGEFCSTLKAAGGQCIVQRN